MGCHFLLQGIFPTQGLNLGLPHCRQTLYYLSYQGSPKLAIPQYKRKKQKKYWNRLPFSTPGDLPNPGIEPTFSYVSCIGGQVLTTSTTWIFMYPMLDLFLSFQTLFPFQGSPSLMSLLNCPEIIHIKNHNRTTGLQQVKENQKTAGMLQG